MDEAATSCSYQQAGSVSRKCVLTIIVLHRAGDRALRRRSIKLLFAGSAFRVSVSGLVLGLNGGRRAQPGHVVKDRGSPPCLHPRRCGPPWSAFLPHARAKKLLRAAESLVYSLTPSGVLAENHPKRSGFRRPKEGSKMPKEAFFTAICRWRVVSRRALDASGFWQG